ncbi:MAG: hypothetical protein JWP02_3164 [Acidimicrobiales bacterium]|nr:hypothetical protein [Acidimicrobiales bacterium]
MTSNAPDELTTALRATIDVLEAEIENAKAIIEQARAVNEERERGASYGAAVQNGNPVVGARLVTTTLALRDAATGLRRAEARVLYNEGLTMRDIGEVFGVSRQRVSVLLRPPTDADDATI